MNKVKYPIGLQDFAGLIEDGYTYVDKTDLVFNLTQNYKYVFLARPRRFGKSLLLSTIRYYYHGRKDLFQGLKIMDLEKNWVQFPVIFLMLSRVNTNDNESLNEFLNNEFLIWEKRYDIKVISNDLSSRFSNIIREAYNKCGQKVVVLIDEYDNSLINTLENEEIYVKNRNILKSIYSNLKDLDEYIKFAMLTGVSRFSKTSIFSGLNNLTDITFNDRFSDICGFTESEVNSYFQEGIRHISEIKKVTFNEAALLLKNAYDGYHFSTLSPDIYNPYSIMRALDEGKISDFWMETATPSFLVERLRETSKPLLDIFSSEADESSLSESDTLFSSPVSLLFQTGYLTIKGYEEEKNQYILGIPNKEVEKGLFKALLGGFAGKDKVSSINESSYITKPLLEGNITEFLSRLREFLATIPYNVMPKISEKYFENIMYLILRLNGINVEAEKTSAFGRSDIIALTPKEILIFELKLDSSSDEAVEQIKEKKYYAPFINDKRDIFMIGLNFSSSTRNLSDWKIETFN